MIRALYVKCQLAEMMKMIKGRLREIETYIQLKLTAWGLRMERTLTGKMKKNASTFIY